MKNTNKLIVSLHDELMDADVTQGNEVFIGRCEIWLNLLFIEEQKIKKWAQTKEKDIEAVSIKTYHNCKQLLYMLVKTMRIHEDCEKRQARYGMILASKRMKRLATKLRIYEKPAKDDYDMLVTIMNHCETLNLTVTDYTQMTWQILGRMEKFIQDYDQQPMKKLRARTQQQRNDLEMLDDELIVLNKRAHYVNESNEDLLQDIHDVLDATEMKMDQLTIKP
ncbi:hypothetical protein CN918_30325 [Priestia megaterium]|nr:hypothetical protein CN918_30325 [Priestia megaterium]